MADWWEEETVVGTEETSENWWEQETVVDSVENQTQAALNQAEVAEPVNAVPYDAALLKAEKDRGVSDTNLVNTLISQGASVLSVNDQPFRLEDARAAGVSDDEIMKILITGEPYANVNSELEAFGQGANLGLSNILGAPVDVINWAGGQVERGGRAVYNKFADEPVSTELDDTWWYSDNPVGGSENIRDGMSVVTEAVGGNPIIDDIDEIRPEYRPYAQGGRVVGESAIMMTPFGLARAGIGASHPIIARAAANPNALLTEEVLATIGAAQGAGIAEAISPDNEWAQMGGEFIGAVLNPVGMTYRAGKSAGSFGGKQLSKLRNTIFRGEKGSQDAAIAELLSVADTVGVSAEDLLQSLQTSLAKADPENGIATGNPSGAALTAGQLTGNPILLGFESNLASKSSEFRGVRDASIADAFANLRNLSEAMLRSGEETTRLAGAELQKRYFNNILNVQIANAQDAAAVAASKFDNQDTAGASKAAFEALSNAKTNARNLESSLWEQIPQNVEMGGAGVLSAYETLSKRVLADRGGKFGTGDTDTIIRNFVAALRKEPVDLEGLEGIDPSLAAEVRDFMAARSGEAADVITSGEMLRFRSLMLRQASAAAASGDANAASVLEGMAQGALDDLGNLGGDAVDTARTYSAQFNERFNAGFGRKALRTDSTRRNAINPELTLERGLGGGKATGNLNLRELDEAVRFGDEAAAAVGEEATSSAAMFNAQEEFLRGSVDSLRNPSTGAIDPKRIDKFIADNPDLVVRFPNLKQDMITAADAQIVADDVMENIGKAAENESLVTTVGQVFSGNTPAADFTNLAKLAPDGDSVSGLRNAVVDWSMKDATDAKGNFDFIKFSQNIARPLTDEGKTALDILIETGVMTEEQVSGISSFVEQGLRVQIGSKSPEFIDDIIEENSNVINNLARMVGANVGAKANEFTGTLFGSPNDSGLQSAAIFSAWARNIVDAGPQARTREAMIAMFKDPQLLADAMSRNPEIAQKSSLSLKEVLARIKDTSFTGMATDEVFSKRTAPANALINSEEIGDEEPPLPSSLDNQMEQALPEVDLPTLYFDEDGNPAAPPGF
jgi:hypothetical protein